MVWYNESTNMNFVENSSYVRTYLVRIHSTYDKTFDYFFSLARPCESRVWENRKIEKKKKEKKKKTPYARIIQSSQGSL